MPEPPHSLPRSLPWMDSPPCFFWSRAARALRPLVAGWLLHGGLATGLGLVVGLGLTVGLGPAAGSVAAADASADQIAFFESKIRPILVGHCYECHSVENKKTNGGLSVDSRETLLKGGDSGPALVV